MLVLHSFTGYQAVIFEYAKQQRHNAPRLNDEIISGHFPEHIKKLILLHVFATFVVEFPVRTKQKIHKRNPKRIMHFVIECKVQEVE